MQKPMKIFTAILFAVLCASVSSIAEETITLTTYYPAPYGAYEELTTTGNTYLATDSGSVGIGTTNPGGPLEVRRSSDGSGLFKIGGNGDYMFGSGGTVFIESTNWTFNGHNNMSLTGYAGNNMPLLTLKADTTFINGTVNATGYSVSGTSGASGTFTSLDGKTVTVINGIITSII